VDEFIVWDEARKSFIDYEAINEFNKPSLKDINVFAYIGLNDIDDKKIYADCSIIEFEFGTGGEYHKMTGYFSYNNQTLRYEIKDVNKREAIYLWTGYIEKEIKIIDTIQENKLGLIK